MNLKNTFKNLTRLILPPVIYDLLVRFKSKKTWVPKWNTIGYEPLKNIQIFFDPSGSWQKKMLTDTYDTYFFQRLKDLSPEGKVIYDIGAHIGFHSFYASRLVGSAGKVHAFEPHPKNAERLKMIVERNRPALDNISVHEVAVSSMLGKEEFTMNNDIESGRSSGNFINSANTFWTRDVYTEKGFFKASVKTVPVDAFQKELGLRELPDIMKIDVEGAEHQVLLGAKNTLLSKKPVMFIEIHSMQNMYNVLNFLDSISYKTELINTDRNGVCFIEASARKS